MWKFIIFDPAGDAVVTTTYTYESWWAARRAAITMIGDRYDGDHTFETVSNLV